MMKLTESERLFAQLRQVQRKTNCSDNTCNAFIKAFGEFTKVPVDGTLKKFDTKAKDFAGCKYIVLHGCPKCNKYVYTPDNPSITCPQNNFDGTVCGHPRFDEKGKPHEVRFDIVFVNIYIFIFCLIVCSKHSTSRLPRDSKL